MRGILDKIRSKGAELVVIGSGRVDQAAFFRQEQQIDFPLLTDPDLVAYRAAGLRRGFWTSFNLETLLNAWRTRRRGFRQAGVQGDPWQQGGTFVIRPGGTTVFSHISRVAGDHAAGEDILRALE